MPVEVTTDEFVDFGLAGGMEVLEFVHRLELDDVQAVRKNAIGFALEKMLALVGGDMGNGGEYVSAMGRRTFDAVSVVDSAFSRFMVDVKVLQVVVEIDRACA